MHALQDLGEALIALDPKRLAELATEAALPERLVDAIHEARSITAWGGRKRQRQFVGKLMRDVDPEPIRRRLDLWAHGHAIDSARQHALEQWRDRLIAEPAALDLLAAAEAAARSSAFPGADRPSPRRACTRTAAPRVSRALSRIEGARCRGRRAARLIEHSPPEDPHGIAADRPRLDFRSCVVRRLHGQGHPRPHRMVHRGAALAVADGEPAHSRRAAADRAHARRARRHRRLSPGADHRRHRPRAARRDAGGDRSPSRTRCCRVSASRCAR